MSDDPIHFRVLNEIGIINQLAQTAFERVMPAGMTLAQFTVLNHFVRLGGEKSPAELARAFQLTKATMSSTLRKLEAKALVVVAPDPEDGRGKRVAITDEGRQMRARCIAALAPELARLGDLWPADQARTMLPDLAALRALLDARRRKTGTADQRPGDFSACITVALTCTFGTTSKVSPVRPR